MQLKAENEWNGIEDKKMEKGKWHDLKIGIYTTPFI